jgi:3-hydroxyisobutyrate dehydrogenase-like beta-hydroxyacid dehydrogenase
MRKETAKRAKIVPRAILAAINFAGGTMERERIGFIGVGLMGHGMAKNIVEKGFPLTVLAHRNRERSTTWSHAARRGGSLARTRPGERHRRALRHRQPAGRGRARRPRGLAAAAGRCSSSTARPRNPSSTARLARDLAPAKGITLVDAPLSRTPKDAEAGTLDVMAAGEPDASSPASARCSRPSPAASSTPARSAAAHAMKLLNNFVSMGYAALYSEALALGAKAGSRRRPSTR